MDLPISSRNTSSAVNIRASVLTKMTDSLTSHLIDTSQWDFNKPSSIDLLIGESHNEDILIGNNRLQDSNCGIKNRISMSGLVVIGRDQTEKSHTNDLLTFFVSSEPENFQRFWALEVPAAQLWTTEEKRCDNQFKETTRRSPEGRFIVKFPS